MYERDHSPTRRVLLLGPRRDPASHLVPSLFAKSPYKDLIGFRFAGAEPYRRVNRSLGRRCFAILLRYILPPAANHEAEPHIMNRQTYRKTWRRLHKARIGESNKERPLRAMFCDLVSILFSAPEPGCESMNYLSWHGAAHNRTPSRLVACSLVTS